MQENGGGVFCFRTSYKSRLSEMQDCHVAFCNRHIYYCNFIFILKFQSSFQYGFKEFVNGELLKMKVMGGIREVQLELCTNAFFESRVLVKAGKITSITHFADFGESKHLSDESKHFL